jgi:hypothetical protein
MEAKMNLKAVKLEGIKFADPDNPNDAYSMGGWGVIAPDGTWLTLNKGGLVSAWRTKGIATMIAQTIIQDDLTQNQWLTSHAKPHN